MHCNHNDLYFTYITLSNKLNSYRGDIQLYFYEDDQQTFHTITSRNGTIISDVFNKIPNQTNLWQGPRYTLIF